VSVDGCNGELITCEVNKCCVILVIYLFVKALCVIFLVFLICPLESADKAIDAFLIVSIHD